MAFALVRSAVPVGTSAPVTTLTSAALGATPTVGDLLVFAIVGNEASSADPVFATPSGWTVLATAFSSPIPRAVMYGKIAGASEPTTVAVSWSLAAGAEILGPYEFSGPSGLNLERAVTNTQAGVTNPVVTSPAPTTDGTELIVVAQTRTSLVTGSTPTGGFTLDHDGENTNAPGTRCGGTFLHKILSGNETPSCSITLSGGADSTTLMAILQLGGAAGGSRAPGRWRGGFRSELRGGL